MGSIEDGVEHGEDIRSFPANFPTPVNITVGDRDDSVMMLFDRSISWLQMDAETAIKVAEMVKERAIAVLRSK